MRVVAWRFVLTDSDYQPVGEVLNASSRAVGLSLGVPSASFLLRMDNPLANQIITSDGYIKAYHDTSLEFFGPVISAEEAGDNATQAIQVTAAGAIWGLTKRLSGKSTGGASFTLTDRAQIAKQLIDTTNLENETGIRTGVLACNADSASTYTTGPYKPTLDCITELGKVYLGFDWEVVPIEPTTLSRKTAKIGDFHAQPVIGQPRTDAVFEYGFGTRANVASYRVLTSRDTQANQVFHVPADGTTAPTVGIDNLSINEFGLMEDLAAADLTDVDLRQQLVNAHINVRKMPRRVVSFVPHLDNSTHRVPQFGTDFRVGDIVTARAKVLGSVRLDSQVRVYGVSISIDDLGMESVELTLVEE